MVKKIIIYTTEFCSWCRRTKEFFKEHMIKYKEINVEKDMKAQQEMIKKSGQLGVPVIDIDGKIIVGFDEEKLKAFVRIK